MKFIKGCLAWIPRPQSESRGRRRLHFTHQDDEAWAAALEAKPKKQTRNENYLLMLWHEVV